MADEEGRSKLLDKLREISNRVEAETPYFSVPVFLHPKHDLSIQIGNIRIPKDSLEDQVQAVMSFVFSGYGVTREQAKRISDKDFMIRWVGNDVMDPYFEVQFPKEENPPE